MADDCEGEAPEGAGEQAPPAQPKPTVTELLQVPIEAKPAPTDRETQADKDKRWDRHLRIGMGIWAALVSTGQLVAMNFVLFKISDGTSKLTDNTFKWYMAETFGALLGVCYVVFKYLFPERKQG